MVRLSLFGGAFGSLDGVDLDLAAFIECGLHVGGKVAGVVFPFHGRFRVALAVSLPTELMNAVAAVAFLHYGITFSQLVRAAPGCHKSAFHPFFNGIAVHTENNLHKRNKLREFKVK